MKTTLFTSADIADLVLKIGLDCLMDDTIEEINKACLNFDENVHVVPARAGFNYDQPRTGLLEWMPAMVLGDKVVIKLVGYHPHNPDQLSLPTILSTILVFDTASGHLLSVCDGTFLTSVRTGAASAVASRILASESTSTLGLIGAGAQAVTQLHALSRVFDLQTVLVHDSDTSTENDFAQRCASLKLKGTDIRIASADEICSVADIICTATSVAVGAGPVMRDTGLRDNVHINAVGSDFPGKVELPVSLLRRSLVCPDFHSQALAEGECQQLDESLLGPDLADLVKHPERYAAAREKPTVFDSTGWALEDYVVMEVISRHAREQGCGRDVALESLSKNPKDPYAFLRDQPGANVQAAIELLKQA